MVVRSDFECRFEGVTVSDYWDLLYSDGTASSKYYAEVYNDQDAWATEWENDKRVVSATMPLNLPGFAKSIIGCDAVGIQDTQTVQWETGADGTTRSSFSVECVPMMMTTGAAKFTVRIEYSVSDTKGPSASSDCSPFQESQGVLVQVAISAIAAGPWGLTGSIEKIMVGSSRGGVESWLQFGERYIQERLEERAGSGLMATITRAVTGSFIARSTASTRQLPSLDFRTRSTLEGDIRAAMNNEGDELDILEAVDSRKSMCDLAKDSLFFEGGLSRSYQQCMLNALYCAETLDGEDPISCSTREGMVGKVTAIRKTLQTMEQSREKFLAVLHEYEVENGVLVHRLVNEIQRLKGELTLAKQEALLANDVVRTASYAHPLVSGGTDMSSPLLPRHKEQTKPHTVNSMLRSIGMGWLCPCGPASHDPEAAALAGS